MNEKTIEKYEFIINYLEKEHMVDVLDSNFVDTYIDKFKVEYKGVMYGAMKCKNLSTILLRMYNDRIVTRDVIGLSGEIAGFPKWVYCYCLRKGWDVKLLLLKGEF